MQKIIKKSHKVLSIEEQLYNLHEYGICPHSRELFLHPFVHFESEASFATEPGMDYRMAANFIKNMAFLNTRSKDPILIHQSSIGGDWNYGMAIYDTIAQSASHVTIVAYAHARSMSSITLQAADLRVLMPNADFLVHHGTLEFSDRATPVVSNVQHWEQVEKPKMVEIYARRCQKGKFFVHDTLKQVKQAILDQMEKKVDWILTPEQAVSYGFADGILGQKGFRWKDLR